MDQTDMDVSQQNFIYKERGLELAKAKVFDPRSKVDRL